MKDFMVQGFFQIPLSSINSKNIGGDPTNSGDGGESIYERAFKDEFHHRLKFTHRGLVLRF